MLFGKRRAAAKRERFLRDLTTKIDRFLAACDDVLKRGEELPLRAQERIKRFIKWEWIEERPDSTHPRYINTINCC